MSNQVSIPAQFDAIYQWGDQLRAVPEWSETEFEEALEIMVALSALWQRIETDGSDAFLGELAAAVDLAADIEGLVTERRACSLPAAAAKLRFDVTGQRDSLHRPLEDTLHGAIMAIIDDDLHEAAQLLRSALRHPAVKADVDFGIRIEDALRHVEPPTMGAWRLTQDATRSRRRK